MGGNLEGLERRAGTRSSTKSDKSESRHVIGWSSVSLGPVNPSLSIYQSVVPGHPRTSSAIGAAHSSPSTTYTPEELEKRRRARAERIKRQSQQIRKELDEAAYERRPPPPTSAIKRLTRSLTGYHDAAPQSTEAARSAYLKSITPSTSKLKFLFFPLFPLFFFKYLKDKETQEAIDMALAPKFAGQALSTGVTPKAVHTLELFLDYVCPFSKKQFDTFYHDVAPLIEQKYSSKLQVIFRQQIQPWHPSSTLVHEAAVAVLRTDASKFWPFSAALFDKQTDYFDVSVVNETRNQTYKRLAKLATGVGLDEAKIYGMLEISDKPGEDGSLNSGNQTTNDLKLLIKAGRLVGVHVSPTVMFNGLNEPSISSSFTKKDWEQWLEKNVV